MRVRGDSEGCRQAARELRRAAAEVDRAGQGLPGSPVLGWTGRGAQQWSNRALGTRGAARFQGQQLAAAARSVERFAEDLEALQARARRLSTEATDAGLWLDEDGRIPPVPTDLDLRLDPDLRRALIRRREVRRQLLTVVADIRAQEEEVHARLRRELAALHRVRCPGPGSRPQRGPAWWVPSWWDAPPLVLTGGQVVAQVRQSLPPLLRSTPVTGGAGLIYGMASDLEQGRDLDDALTKHGSVLGATALGGVGAGIVLASAPVVIAGTGVVVVGAGVGYGVGKAFDAWGHRLPWVDKPRRRSASSTQSGPRPRRAAEPTPQAGPAPLPPPAPSSPASPAA